MSPFIEHDVGFGTNCNYGSFYNLDKMSGVERIKANIPGVIIGTIIGVAIGWLLSYISLAAGSQCTIMCKPLNVMILTGVLGFVMAIK